MRRDRVATVAALALTTVVLAGCDKFSEPYKDAPRSGQNNNPAKIITMPDGFSNVSAKCDGPDRIFVIYHANSKYGSIDVVPNDPVCTGR